MTSPRLILTGLLLVVVSSLGRAQGVVPPTQPPSGADPSSWFLNVIHPIEVAPVFAVPPAQSSPQPAPSYSHRPNRGKLLGTVLVGEVVLGVVVIRVSHHSAAPTLYLTGTGGGFAWRRRF